MATLTVQDQLRLYLGERIPAGGTAADTFFSDDEIQMLLDSSSYGIHGAAVMGWAAKAGEYARLIDIAESGGNRSMSQKFRQAMTQLNYYQGLVNNDILISTSSGRIAGKSIDWADIACGPGFAMYRQRYNRFPPLIGGSQRGYI